MVVVGYLCIMIIKGAMFGFMFDDHPIDHETIQILTPCCELSY